MQLTKCTLTINTSSSPTSALYLGSGDIPERPEMNNTLIYYQWNADAGPFTIIQNLD
jgi:hypothetical protein